MDLDFKRVIRSIPKAHEPEELAPLMTEWGERLMADPSLVPLTEHPRPQFARPRVWMLNGWWEYAVVPSFEASETWRTSRAPREMDGVIRVPFSPETRLSGVGIQLQPDELLWYRCKLPAPNVEQEERCILHFDGVDHACAVYYNTVLVGEHIGAYQPFSFDVTDLCMEGEQTIEVCVYDPSDSDTQLRGKQCLERGGMWYTAQSGIWQSVWLEAVPEVHVEDLRIVADPDRSELRLTAWLSGRAILSVDVLDADGVLAGQGRCEPAEGVGIVELDVTVSNPHLWSPDDPYLYRLRLSYGADQVRSYCAFRTVSVEKDSNGVARLCVNHQPFFCRGLLDQGYWPDSLMTPPSDEAIVFDLQFVRDMGFNMVRKHIKVESERWYWHCDRLGLLVWQDMPSGGDKPANWQSRDKPTLFKGSWHTMRDNDASSQRKLGAGDEQYRKAWTENMSQTVSRLSNHPSVMIWVLFNESWGQFDAGIATQMAWELDPTRPVLSASGWYDQGTGDIHGVHNYFRGMHMFKDHFGGGRHGTRAQVVSECGGLTWHVDGHSSLSHSYGYAEFASEEEWRLGLRELLDSADALEEQGLSGFVYTQLSDVEEETNGLLTYDRRVSKLG